jgi:hypothetical protein
VAGIKFILERKRLILADEMVRDIPHAMNAVML